MLNPITDSEFHVPISESINNIKISMITQEGGIEFSSEVAFREKLRLTAEIIQ